MVFATRVSEARVSLLPWSTAAHFCQKPPTYTLSMLIMKSILPQSKTSTQTTLCSKTVVTVNGGQKKKNTEN